MKFGIIGLGNHAINRVMPAIISSGNQISAVYSRNMEKAEKESLPYGAIPFSDINRFFAEGDFESVYIASPNFLHYRQAKESLENGKNVLLEKQMTLKNDEASDLVKIAERNSLSLAVGFHMRFHPAVRLIRDMIQSGQLGKITMVSGLWGGYSQGGAVNPDREWWNQEDKVGGGSVMGTGVHVIDTINYILASRPLRVSAVRVPHGKIIDTTEIINMEYNGTLAQAISSRSMANPRNDLMVTGTKGTVLARNVFSTTVASSIEMNGSVISEFKTGNMYKDEVKAFVDLVEERTSDIALGKDGEAVVRIVNAAFLSDLEERWFRMEL